MKIEILLMALMILSQNQLQAYPCLLLTEEETSRIRKNLLKGESHPLKLHVSAIIYCDKDHWSLWVNDKVFHPETVHKIEGFRLKSTMPGEVTFEESLTQETFTLRPHQTYRVEDQKIGYD